MTLRNLAHPALATLLFGAVTTTVSATTDWTLSNNVVELKFVQEGSAVPQTNLWLTSIKSLGGQTITLEQGRPLWIVEALADPDQAAVPPNFLTIFPDDLPLVQVRKAIVPGTGERLLTATWGPALVPLPDGWDAGTTPPLPQVKVIATWSLKPNEDAASTTVSVQITNPDDIPNPPPTATPYRLWLTRYPRLVVDCLDSDGDQNHVDRLAMGRNGGILYGNPIHYEYVDPATSVHYPLVLTQEPDTVAHVISADSAEPSTLSIPACSYYNGDSKLGLYYSNDDHEGYIKGIYWTQDSLGTAGSLLVQTVQFATGNIYNAKTYTSPYKVQVAALDKGDWVGAAQKYRTTWRSFTTYPKPSGSPLNHLFSQALKDTPIAVWLNSGDGYCIFGSDPFDSNQAQADLDGLSEFIAGSPAGMAFPLVYLSRFPVDPPHEVFLNDENIPFAEYQQTPSMQTIRDFIAGAEADGHQTLIQGMSEKTFNSGPDSANPNCNMFSACCYCTFDDDPDLENMLGENAIIRKPGFPHVGAPCSKGKSDLALHPTWPHWPAWFAKLNAEFSNGLGSTGGLGWPSPNPTAGWCFALNHDHEPGFGNFLAQGWLNILNSTASQVTSTTDFARTMETSVAFFSTSAGIQNTWNFDIAKDFNHYKGVLGSDPLLYDFWKNAPISRIPMMQMAIDNAMYASVYAPQTLTYPFAEPYFPAASAIFEPYPAVTGSLACWSMAERVLTYQSLVYLALTHTPVLDMVPFDDVNAPGTENAKHAAADMFHYYRGLARFLQGTAPLPLIKYHTGSLERSPTISINGVTQTFVLPKTKIDQSFPTLKAVMDALGYKPPDYLNGSLDLDWAKYWPLKNLLQGDSAIGTIWIPAEPEADPSYLPSGMYRHCDDTPTLTTTSLAFLISNPWGVKHQADGCDQCANATPMNPFTFNYLHPLGSPTTTYTYQFTFDPANYENFSNQYGYDAAVAVYDVEGQIFSQTSFQHYNGAFQFSGTLAAQQNAAWVFKETPPP